MIFFVFVCFTIDILKKTSDDNKRKRKEKKIAQNERRKKRVMYIKINIQFYSTPQVIAVSATAHKIFENDEDVDEYKKKAHTQQKYLTYFY